MGYNDTFIVTQNGGGGTQRSDKFLNKWSSKRGLIPSSTFFPGIEELSIQASYRYTIAVSFLHYVGIWRNPTTWSSQEKKKEDASKTNTNTGVQI